MESWERRRRQGLSLVSEFLRRGGLTAQRAGDSLNEGVKVAWLATVTGAQVLQILQVKVLLLHLQRHCEGVLRQLGLMSRMSRLHLELE